MKHLRKGLLALMALGIGTAVIGGLSTALFTDTAQIQNSTFTTGTVDIDLTDNNETLADNLANTQITLTTMAPGDSVQPITGVTATNNGSLALRYALYASGTNADSKNLVSQLQLSVRTVDVVTADGNCDDFDGTALATNATVSTTSTSVFGSSTAGSQAGDRALAAAAAEVLCFRVSLPTTVGNTYQNATTTLTWEFLAEQTANN